MAGKVEWVYGSGTYGRHLIVDGIRACEDPDIGTELKCALPENLDQMCSDCREVIEEILPLVLACKRDEKRRDRVACGG